MWTREDFSALDSRIILDSYKCVKYISLDYPKSEYMNIISVISKNLDLVFLVQITSFQSMKINNIDTNNLLNIFNDLHYKITVGNFGGTHPVPPPPPPKIDKIKFNHKLLLAKKMYNFLETLMIYLRCSMKSNPF